MNILILGAGQVGRTVAQNLASEENDITVIDRDPELLRLLQERLDLRTVIGHAAHPEVLIEAGIEGADLILAVTNSDETNMVACLLAHVLFKTPTRLARVRDPHYLAHPELFTLRTIPIDHIVSPERLVTDAIAHLIDQPGCLQILDFIDGRAQLAVVRVLAGSPMMGQPLHQLPQQVPGLACRLVAIYRRGQVIMPEGTTRVEAQDEIFFLAAREALSRFIGAFHPSQAPYRNVMIAGGGNIGKQLAERLVGRHRVKILELDAGRCRELVENLDDDIRVLHGNAGDADLLREEDIASTDVFCALTSDEEDNIISAALAKQLGVRKTIAIVNTGGYIDLVQDYAVDIAISPAQVTIGAILTHIRRGDVVAVHALRRGAAEAIELTVHGDHRTSRVIGRPINRLGLPAGTSVGVIARQGQLLFPHHDTRLAAEDRVVLFLADKGQIHSVERLFHAELNFL
jgi:trk system potassium uptake protein TrkA